MEGQQRGRAQADGDLADPSWTQKQRQEAEEQPIADAEIRRALPRPTQDDELLLEKKILADDRPHAAGAAELRGRDRQVEQREEEMLHARDSLGQNSTPRNIAPSAHFPRELRIRDRHGRGSGRYDRYRRYADNVCVALRRHRVFRVGVLMGRTAPLVVLAPATTPLRQAV